MHRYMAVASIVAATWALGACGVQSSDEGRARAAQVAPGVLVDLESLPDGHPPVPGFPSSSALPEGHPPVPGFDSSPALPEGHPRCPARGSLEAPPSDAGLGEAVQSPPELIRT